MAKASTTASAGGVALSPYVDADAYRATRSIVRDLGAARLEPPISRYEGDDVVAFPDQLLVQR